MNRLGVCFLVATGILNGAWAQPAPDWAALNARARAESAVPIRNGVPGKTMFWNQYAREFIHAPAFEFPAVRDATSYRFEFTSAYGGAARPVSFTAPTPWAAVPPEVWTNLPLCRYALTVTGLDEAGNALQPVSSRTVCKAPCFEGPYPSAPRGYREAAIRCFDGIFHQPYVQAWLEAKKNAALLDTFRYHCYPAKMESAIIKACIRQAEFSPQDRAAAEKIARACADDLFAITPPPGAPTYPFPPTYRRSKAETGVTAGYSARIMLHYPIAAADAFFALDRAFGSEKCRKRALEIAERFVKTQGSDGSWPVCLDVATGKPSFPNRLVPDGPCIYSVLETAGKLTDDPAYTNALARLDAFVENGALKTWSWDGQFEDVTPQKPYFDQSKYPAIAAAFRLLAKGRVAEAKELVDWSEDQFVIWSIAPGNPGDDSANPGQQQCVRWRTPVGIEQYCCFLPINASSAALMNVMVALGRKTHDPLPLAQARALADRMVLEQWPDGYIPTFFGKFPPGENLWLNCAASSAEALLTLAEAADDAPARAERK